jgi:hypothetical protein
MSSKSGKKRRGLRQLVEAAIDADDLELHAYRIGHIDPVGDVEFVPAEVMSAIPQLPVFWVLFELIL